MTILIILVILLLLWWFFFRRKKKPGVPTPSPPLVTPVTHPLEPETVSATITRKHVRHLERKTYVSGLLLAKYYGELDYIKDLQEFVRERYYDFTLYDAELRECQIRRNNEGPFPEFQEEDLFPGPVQPSPLPCNIVHSGVYGSFQVLLHDVKLARIDMNKHRLLHQQEDDEVFGTLEAEITGYMLEHFDEQFETVEPVEDIQQAEDVPVIPKRAASAAMRSAPYKTELATGRIKTENGYRWTEYWYSNRQKTYWGRPVLAAGNQAGCASALGWIFLIIAGSFFLAAIGPRGIMVLLPLAAVSLLIIFFSSLLRALLWIIVGLVVVGAILGITGGQDRQSARNNPSPARNELKESTRRSAAWTNTRDSTVLDSVIIHHRVWHDYDSGRYEGDVMVRIADWKASAGDKNAMPMTHSMLAGYDKMLAGLAVGDSGRLRGVYALLDSIKLVTHLDSLAFAQVVVSFVQDIPYALVLDGDCDPNAYTDAFTRRYLLSPGAVCEGYQRFGINSPVEFIATLRGDCDTRTLLLFTMLTHYGYDVAILSSEVYAHSLLGICLPLGGLTFDYHGRKYVLWETTAPDIRPGLIPSEVSNLLNWRVSITSQK